MARGVAVPVSLLVLVAALAGCGAATVAKTAARPAVAAAAPPPDRSVVVPAGYRQHTVREAGISVALPIGWQVVGARDAVFPGVAENLTRLDRDFRAPLSALSWPDSPLKLFAFDRIFWHHRATTAMVAQVTYGSPGAFARWSRRVVAQLAHAPGIVGRVHAAQVTLGARTELRAVYRTTTGDTVVDYFLAGRDGVWVLMFRTPTARVEGRTSAFARAAGTFVLEPPFGGPVRSDPQLPA